MTALLGTEKSNFLQQNSLFSELLISDYLICENHDFYPELKMLTLIGLILDGEQLRKF
ncbi:hypothetical protein GXM_09354 [Nostoc sphaeroides CCNUC1]|uniref:Uncharacterized protein n=1 Tax=Nostoc sphaeroides CCNUC1 TaxID=2653204 RepID=A0A5P8WGX1_9NOSO|nr:hypothetical protein GXM_09354 [Nostoc sphaeroides CCNUC1]